MQWSHKTHTGAENSEAYPSSVTAQPVPWPLAVTVLVDLHYPLQQQQQALHAPAVVHPVAQSYNMASSWLYQRGQDENHNSSAASNLDQIALWSAAVEQQGQ